MRIQYIVKNEWAIIPKQNLTTSLSAHRLTLKNNRYNDTLEGGKLEAKANMTSG